MCLGDLLRMSQVTFKTGKFTNSTNWQKFLDPNPSRAGIVFLPSASVDVYVWTDSTLANTECGFLLDASTTSYIFLKYLDYGRLVQSEFWSRGASATPTFTWIELLVPAELMNEGWKK